MIFHGGVITVDGYSWSAAIGGGVNQDGGTVRIYGGTIHASANDPGYGAQEAIGHGSGGSDGTKSIVDGLRVRVGTSTTPVNASDRISAMSNHIIHVEPCTAHNFSSSNTCTYCNVHGYMVTYNGNDNTSGSVPTDATTYQDGVNTTVTVLGNTGSLQRTGYTFDNWNTQSNGGGTNYSPGSTFTISSQVTLYAKWTPITYTVRFNKNASDATGTMSDMSFTYGTAQNLTLNQFQRPCDTFVGWSTSPTGAVVYTNGQSVNNLATVQSTVVNLYAQWNPHPVIVSTTSTNANYCKDETSVTALTVNVAGGSGTPTYQWFKNGTAISGATTDTYTPATDVTGDFDYSVKAGNVCGIDSIHIANIHINPLPTITPTPLQQTITYGSPITAVVITNTNSDVTPPTLPAGFAYDITSQTITAPKLGVGDYVINVYAESDQTPNCGTASAEVKVTVTKNSTPIVISSGTNSWLYDGSAHSEETYTVTYNGVAVTNVDATGKVFTLPTGDTLRISNPASITNVSETANNNNTYSYTLDSASYYTNVTANYGKLTIQPRALTITSATASKEYDGTPLTLTNFDFTVTGGTSLAPTDSLVVTITGSQTCQGESASHIASYQVLRVSDLSVVTTNYDPISTVDGLLKVTPTTIPLTCPATVVITLTEGNYDTVVPQSLLGTPTHTLITSGHAHAGNNLSSVNPMRVGNHTVTWTLYDDCDSSMVTCDQTVTVQYQPCEGTLTVGSNSYAYKRIGYQCWFTENLRETSGEHSPYGDDASNVADYGYLYTWYTAAGVTENDDADVPTTATAANGTLYVQGICPTGWSIGSESDYMILNTNSGGTEFLKEPSTLYWLSGYEGTAGPLNTGFKARGGGWFNSAINRYEDFKTNCHFWRSDSTPGSSLASSSVINFYCDSIVGGQNDKHDKRSVRCIRKVNAVP